MKVGKRSGVVWALALAIGYAAQAADPRVQVGDVERVQKPALAVFQSKGRLLGKAAPVLFEDVLITGKDARLTAQLIDGTKLTLGERAEMLIDEFVYKPDGKEAILSLKVVKGAFLFVSGEIEKISGNSVQIVTPVGILGVRGTTVWGGDIDSGYGILVLDGSVAVTTPNGAVTVNGGQGTMIHHGRPPSKPSEWKKKKIDRAMATISFKED